MWRKRAQSVLGSGRRSCRAGGKNAGRSFHLPAAQLPAALLLSLLVYTHGCIWRQKRLNREHHAFGAKPLMLPRLLPLLQLLPLLDAVGELMVSGSWTSGDKLPRAALLTFQCCTGRGMGPLRARLLADGDHARCRQRARQGIERGPTGGGGWGDRLAWVQHMSWVPTDGTLHTF